MPETFENATDINELIEMVDLTRQHDNLGEYRRKPIFKVPEKYTKIDKRAYEPVCLSIGPYHYPKGEGKEYILNDVIQRSHRTTHDYCSKLITHEREFRDHYENIQPEISHKFLEILLLDSVFILWIINPKNEDYMGPELTLDHYRDMFLVENQIPFDVLNMVFATAHGERQEQPLSLLLAKKIIVDYFECLMIPMMAPERGTDPVHLLHLVHNCLAPLKERNSSVFDCNKNQQYKFRRWNRAVEYHQAGVQFKKMDLQRFGPHTLLDIEFKNGVLWIPGFCIDENTPDFFRNLVTFEILTPATGVRKYVTAYIIFMSQLLSMPEDVTLLYQNEIIDNQLGRDEYVSKMFENLAQALPAIGGSYYEKSFGRELEKHYSNRWNKWMAWLKRKHFDNPWLFLALVVATVLLVSEILQAVFSAFSYLQPPQGN